MVGLASLLLSAALVSADDSTALVNLGQPTGDPRYLAAGFINGIPFDYPNQIPDSFYNGIVLNSARNGGGQLAGGWITSYDSYRAKMDATITNYRVCRQFGADFIIGVHGLWGDPTKMTVQDWPGDHGNWTSYDNFVDQIMDDLVAYDALEAMNWDIWNEANLDVFWNRTDQQWIELANPKLNSVLISGPTLANAPTANSTWWTRWLDQVAGNDTIPDQYVYHLEGIGPDQDPHITNASLIQLLKDYGLPERQINIHEYALLPDETPSGYAWWISRLERYDMIGLLGNYQNGLALDDLWANLLTKTDDPLNYNSTNYAPAAGYPVFAYYTKNMTGTRVSTTGSNDGVFDTYATMDDERVRILAGPRTATGDFSVSVNCLESAGYAPNDNVTIDGWAFLGTNDIFAVAQPPKHLDTTTYQYCDGAVTIPIAQVDNHTAWAFEFDVKK